MAFEVTPVAGGSADLSRDAQYPWSDRFFEVDLYYDSLEASKTDHIFDTYFVWHAFKIVAAVITARVFTKTNPITFTVKDDSPQTVINAATMDTIVNGAAVPTVVTVDPEMIFKRGACLMGIYTSGAASTAEGVHLRLLCQPV